jgi:hypothetical protein
MKKIIASFFIFVFVSLSFSFSVYAEYNTRQLPWQLPQIFDEYKESHKYIFICEQATGTSRDVYLYYTHIIPIFSLANPSKHKYLYQRGDTLRYKLINGVFVYNTTLENFYLEARYLEDGSYVYLDYDEWLSHRDKITTGLYVIASNINLKFGNDIWDMSDGLYDLPPPEMPDPGGDDNSGLIGGIVGGILNGLKSLFIPERNIFTDIVAKFTGKFPIVNQISDLLSSLYNIGDNEPVFRITYNDMELKIVDFSSFESYLPLIRNLTGAFLFLSFITREIKILPRLIRGRD